MKINRQRFYVIMSVHIFLGFSKDRNTNMYLPEVFERRKKLNNMRLIVKSFINLNKNEKNHLLNIDYEKLSNTFRIM